MTWRASSQGSAGTVLGWFVGGVAPALAIPGWAFRWTDDPQEPAPAARGDVVLVGYSAGCQGVRSAVAGPHPFPRGVVLIDGAHADLDAPGATIALWRGVFARARRGEALAVATCLAGHHYVERIGRGMRGRAMSTAHVLEAVTGWTLAATCDRPPSGRRPDGTISGRPAETRIAAEHRDGSLYVRSYHSAIIDHAEHAAQLTHVLPEVWRSIVVPDLLGAADTDPAPPPSAASLRERIVAEARATLGIRETPGPANTAWIADALYPCRRGGSPVAGILDATGVRIGLITDATAWCAAHRSRVVFHAGDWTGADRALCPHGYRASVRELCEDSRALGLLRPADGSYVPRPGDAAIWCRAGGNPLLGGSGHMATVVDGGPAFTTIGGNEADAVRESSHRVGEPMLVAFLTLP